MSFKHEGQGLIKMTRVGGALQDLAVHASPSPLTAVDLSACCSHVLFILSVCMKSDILP